MELDEAQTILFDQVSDAIVILDARWPTPPIVAVNQVCRDLLALDDAAILDRPWDTIFAHTSAYGIPDLLRRSIATGEPFAVEGIPLALGVGARPPWSPQQLTCWDWKGLPVRGPGGQIEHLVLIMSDVTARRAIAQADQEKDAFLSLISHEIRSPLTAIKGFAQLATRASPGGERANGRTARCLRAIDQQADRIVHVIGNLSDVARLQGGRLHLQPDLFDLAPLVRAVIERRPADPGTPRIDLVPAGEALIVRADRARIEQALTNLLVNAAKYSPESGQVTVRLDRQGDSAHLAVLDRGIGIPREELPRIFGRFYRATNGAAHGRGGLGLGLFIARQIVLRSGGQIYAESEEGRGSTFHVTLPLARAETERPQARDEGATRGHQALQPMRAAGT